MAKQRIFDLPQTKGTFQLAGIVTGTSKDNFYTEKKTKTGKTFRNVNFGITVNETPQGGLVNYVHLGGMERDNVYYFKRGDKAKGIESVTETVPWKDRNSFQKEGFSLMGVNVGVKKITNDKGAEVNDKKNLVEYDACEEIDQNLVDGVSVFSKGNVEYSTYNDKRRVEFVPTQVSLCKPVDFKADGYVPNAAFTQVFVFMGVAPSEDKSKFIVSGKIVGYSSIEDAEFVIYKRDLALMFKNNLKPYTALKVWGDIQVQQNVDEVEVTDAWGDANKMDRQESPVLRELVITGADPKTIETEIYSQAHMEEAIAKISAAEQAKDDYGKNTKSASSGSAASSGWGTTNTSDSSSDDEDEPW